MKKIYINGKFFSQPITGTQRYAREILNKIDLELCSQENREPSVEILIPRSADTVPTYKKLRVQPVGRMSGIAWEQFELPQYCKGQVLFTPVGGAPLLYPHNVITIHDAAVSTVPSGYSPAYRIWYRQACRWNAPRARHILTVSNFSKSEVVKWYGANPEKTSVVYLGSDHLLDLQPDTSIFKRLGITKKYILAVSSHNPNKNFHRVAQAIGLLQNRDFEVLIAGPSDSRVYRQLEKLPEGVRLLGYVSDAELKSLYENAACFVFASLYEGFGLPALEALSCGCSVVLSRTAALPEIFEGMAYFCDPLSPEDIAAAIQRALNAPPAPPDRLISFARKFSWEKCAGETLKILSAV